MVHNSRLTRDSSPGSAAVPTGHHGGMARRGSARKRPPGTKGLPASLLVGAAVATLFSACTGETSEPPGPHTPPAAALRVATVHGSGLDEAARARLESEVSDVLARYVESGFLGDYPRGGFVQSFADFTSGAAEQAVGDIDVLTAARFEDASSVRATDLGATLSFYVVHGEAVGATAWLDFTFDVDDAGTTSTAALDGRFVLDRRDDRWSVFAYDVTRDDSDALPTEASTP
jgi:hypothetical protein